MTNLIIQGKIPAKSSNRQLYRNKKTGEIVIASSDIYQDYEASFLLQMKNKVFDPLPKNKKGRLAVHMVVLDNAYRQDIDSFPKGVFDCLQKSTAIVNDNKIDEMHVYRTVDKENPRCIIEIAEISKIRYKGGVIYYE